MGQQAAPPLRQFAEDLDACARTHLCALGGHLLGLLGLTAPHASYASHIHAQARPACFRFFVVGYIGYAYRTTQEQQHGEQQQQWRARASAEQGRGRLGGAGEPCTLFHVLSFSCYSCCWQKHLRP